VTELNFCWSDADGDENLVVETERPRSLPRRVAAVLVAVVMGCVGVCLGAGPASAAAGGLLTSNPSSKQDLDTAPGAVTLVFDGKVDDRVAKVLVLDAKGTNVTAGPLIVEATNVTTQLEDDLPKGTYTVHYRVDGKGGEPRGGAFQFSLGGGTFSDPADESWSGSAQEPAILRGDDPNGPEVSDPATSESPGVEVTSSEKPDRSTQVAPPPTTQDPDDPDDPATSGSANGSEDPSSAQTASAVPADSGVGRGFLIGGVVLLLAVAGVSYGVYRSRRSGTHS
jgi:methionine-rich copper-binding protein CopC